MLPKVIAVIVLAGSFQQRSGGVPIGLPQGAGPVPTMGMQAPPTAFEQFVNKLGLDKKTQLPEVQRIFMSAAVDAEAPEREMTSLRLQMLTAARQKEGMSSLIAAYAVQAAKMTAIEAKAFADMRPMLNKGQLSKTVEAFALMAGIFHPPTARGGGRRSGRGGSALMAEMSPVQPALQRGGAGGARAGGGAMMMPTDRESVLTAILFLKGDQKKSFKSVMDEAYKNAAPVRDELAKARKVIGELIDQDAPSESLSQAAEPYGAQAAAMTAAEMTALAQVLALLSEEQRPNTGTINTSASLMRGAFIGKKWNTKVDERFY